MPQWGFYFNQTRCVNCKACVLACKAWNDDKRGDRELNPELGWIEDGKYAEPSEYENLPGSTGEQNYAEYSKFHMKENWRRVTTTEYGEVPPNVDVLNMSISCNHCDNPACVSVCPVKCIYKEAQFGIVLRDIEKQCISCGKCREVCPFGSPQFYDSDLKKYSLRDEARPQMTKCTLCIDRISEGLKPACVAGCLMRALDAGPLEELEEKYPDWSGKTEDFPCDLIPRMNIRTGPNIIFKEKKRRA